MPERRARGAVAASLAGALVVGAVLVLVGAPVAWPFDVVANLAPAPHWPELRAPAAAAPHVVVLQHGLFRTEASLGRLARALRAHGYEVLNPGYASTRGSVAMHATALAGAVSARTQRGPVASWSFVGHSLGGLVVTSYLRRPDAVRPRAVVTLGSPHAGAALADLRKHWFVFRLAMGSEAAFELSPADPLHQLPLPCPEAFGAVAGHIAGDGHPDIPGPDDGTVAVAEALPGAAKARLVLPVGHTWLPSSSAAIAAVLQFVGGGNFPPEPTGR
jgi:hypothetical protein